MSEDVYSIPLSSVVDEFSLEKIFIPEKYESIVVTRSELNRPGLKLSGFDDLFDPRRIQIIGRVEYEYIQSLPEVCKSFADTATISSSVHSVS